jgi:hypothetical protein
MFGKRETEEVVGRDASSKYPSPATEIILNYVLSHLKGDERPYLRLDILGISLLGLLHSGASRTVMGGTAWSQFQTLGLPLLSDTIECTVADGRVCRNIGCIQGPGYNRYFYTRDAYPLPYISSILDQLRDCHYMSSIDIKRAFWQVEVVPDSREYTAFTVPGRGLYQFRRMPFGLINSPATWQRIMDNIIGADLEPHVFVYQHDIIIISRDFEHHMEILRLIFQRLNEAGVSINWKKCQFCRARLRYLGHIVDCKGLRPDTEKVDAILQILEPRNVLEVRRFVGIASWYRRFIPNFASIIAPLTKLTRKNVTFAWTEECSSAFTKLKELLISAPHLSAPDFSRLFTIQCDASSFVLGAVLTQTFDDGERPICYLSRSLTRTERNLSTTEKECLCVIWAVEKLRHYLEGTRFVVITDHNSLLWLHRLKDPQGRLARWALLLQPYDFEIKHRPGKDHVVPDLLSRSVPIMCFTDATKHFSHTNDAWYKRMRENIVSDPLKYPQFRVENNVLFKYVQCRIPELAQEHDYWKKVVPKDSRLKVFSRCHDDVTSGHMGVFKTFQRIRAQLYWPKMKSDIYRYIAGCKACAQHKVEQKPYRTVATRRHYCDMCAIY